MPHPYLYQGRLCRLVGGFVAGYFLSLGALTPEPPGVTSGYGSDRGGARLTERLSERFGGG